MTWAPAFRVTVGGSDITGILAPRLISLTVTDEPGFQSDVLEVDLADDPLMPIAIPRQGAIIRCALGYATQLTWMGEFVADEIELSGPPGAMRIRATASIHGNADAGRTAITTQRSRSWPAGTTLGDLVATIAEEHGLTPAVSPDLASIELPHIDQIDESDANLVTRVALNYDALAKPVAGRLAVVRRALGISAGGLGLVPGIVTPNQVTSWRLGIAQRAAVGTVIAIWRDRAAATDVEVSVGEGEPVRRLRDRFPTEAAAEQAAKAVMARGQRGARRLEVSMPGRPSLGAETPLTLAGFRAGVNGSWTTTRVTHALSEAGFVTTLEAELPG